MTNTINSIYLQGIELQTRKPRGMKVYNYQNPRLKPSSPRQKYGLLGALDRNPFAAKVKSKYVKPLRNKSEFGVASSSDNNLSFQLLGIGILTVAIVLFFQSVFSASLLPASAQTSDLQNKEVRLLTNFQQNPGNGNPGNSKLQEIQIAESVATSAVNNPAKSATQPKKYKVVAGDNLYDVALKFKVDYVELAQKNELEQPYTLKIGQELIIE